MTTLQSTTSKASSETDESPAPRRWNAGEFLQLADMGFFEGQRVELIDGEILNMSPTRNAHTAAISRLTALLAALPSDRYWVRVQATLSLLGNVPDPDIAVVAGPVTSEGDYPTSALLVIEVSDTTLRMDRGKKASLYAAAGVPEYWIVNIGEQQVQVHTSPVSDAAMAFGARYQNISIHNKNEALTPRFMPDLSFPIKLIFA